MRKSTGNPPRYNSGDPIPKEMIDDIGGADRDRTDNLLSAIQTLTIPKVTHIVVATPLLL